MAQYVLKTTVPGDGDKRYDAWFKCWFSGCAESTLNKSFAMIFDSRSEASRYRRLNHLNQFKPEKIS